MFMMIPIQSDNMSCPTNEPIIDFSVFRTHKIDENIRNPLTFLRKMTSCSYFADS